MEPGGRVFEHHPASPRWALSGLIGAPHGARRDPGNHQQLCSAPAPTHRARAAAETPLEVLHQITLLTPNRNNIYLAVSTDYFLPGLWPIRSLDDSWLPVKGNYSSTKCCRTTCCILEFLLFPSPKKSSHPCYFFPNSFVSKDCKLTVYAGRFIYKKTGFLKQSNFSYSNPECALCQFISFLVQS